MDFFEKFCSNSYAGSANQCYFESDGEIKVGNEKSYLRLTEEKLEVYSGGALTYEEENRMNMTDIVMLRIHKKGDKANIALVSSGEKNYEPHSALYSVEADWTEGGKVFAVADKTDLKSVNLKFATE